MKYETFKFIIDNKERFLYNDMAGTGSDNTTDANAATLVNPNDYLAPVVGGSKVIQVLATIALVLGIIYLIKLNLKQ